MDELDNQLNLAEGEVAAAESTKALASVETKYLGSKGSIQAQLRSISALPREERPAFGARVNSAKQRLTELIESRRTELEAGEISIRREMESIET